MMATPFLTILVGGTVILFVIQPVGFYASTWIAGGVKALLNVGGPIAGAVLAGTFLPMVMLGIHQGTVPIHVELINSLGNTPLLPILAMAGAGQVGASLAVYAKTRDRDLRQLILSALPVGILGIGEPLIYGVTLPLGRPFIAAHLGGAVGGAFIAVTKIGALALGVAGVLLAFLVTSPALCLLVILISYAAGFAITFVMGFDERLAQHGKTSRLPRTKNGPDRDWRPCEHRPLSPTDGRRASCVGRQGRGSLGAVAEDDRDAGSRDLQAHDLNNGDVVVALSTSGRTPYCLGALEYARQVGARTVAVTCDRGSVMGQLADIAIEVVVGPEVLAGSTRMKAGTAQKMVLHMLSTAAMVRLGKCYGNRMVDLRPTNAKLLERARRMVADLTGCDGERAAALLEQAGGNVKAAIVMGRTGLPLAEATALLARHGGFVRRALAAWEDDGGG